jgi:hypothetical protein
MHKKKDITRRNFIKKVGKGAGVLAIAPIVWNNTRITNQDDISATSHIFGASDYEPEKNMEMIIDMMGGIGNLIGLEDIVIIKTNAQWWNQGSPNLAALKRFIELILGMPGFIGEIIIADNNHRGVAPWNSGAWANNFEINSDVPNVYNLIDLINLFHSQGYNNVTKYHWLDVATGGKRVFGPEDGDGYVYRTDILYNNGASGDDYRETIMTYPIFTSSYSDTIIDFKNGAWNGSSYTDQPLKLINFAGLCYHGLYVGATSAIKNYLGVSDLSGGPDSGKLIENYYNFHSFPFDGWNFGPVPAMLGGEIGTFLKTIRAADLNITTAEWIGWLHRTDVDKAEHTRTILASTDPIALDYYATKHLLYPVSVERESLRSEYVNPDRDDLPLRQYLDKCNELGIGTLNEEEIQVHTMTATSVKIISFNADIIKNSVELMLTVSTTSSFLGFEIQRSYEDLNFCKIGFKTCFIDSSKVFRYLDENLLPGLYCYRLKLIDSDGSHEYSKVIMVDMRTSKTFSLLHNYPNPFNQETIIQYGIPKSDNVTLVIFDLQGREVVKLMNENKEAGFYSIKWNGKDKYNNNLPSGIYICQMSAENFIQSKKMVLIK